VELCYTQTRLKLEVLKVEFSAASADDAGLDLTVMSTDLHKHVICMTLLPQSFNEKDSVVSVNGLLWQ